MSKLISREAYLDNLVARNRRNREIVDELFMPLTKEQRSWKPAPKEWSVDQCFQHLVTTFNSFLPNISQAMETQVPADSDGMFRPTWLVRRTWGWVYDPNVKSITLPGFKPPEPYYSNVLTDFRTQQDRVDELIERSRDTDLQTRCWYFKIIPLNLGDYFLSFVAHDELHIDQARRVLEAYTNQV